jgi:CHAD domain-containing protein
MPSARKGSTLSLDRDFSKAARDFFRLAGRVREKTDVEDLHQLRIATRRLRAVVWISRHSKTGPRLGRLKKELRALGHTLGERRTLDVLQREANRYRYPKRKQSRSEAKIEENLRRSLSPSKRNRLHVLAGQACSKLRRVKSSELLSIAAEMIAKVEELKRAKPHGSHAWHLVRIEVKKLRYAFEILGLDCKCLKEIQDLLGKAHDLEVMMEHFGKQRRALQDAKKARIKAQRKLPGALAYAETQLLGLRKSH